jgi:mRNA interferase MazF
MIASIPDPVRGEVWYAHFDPVVGHEQGGERPCLVISDDRFNHSRANLVIVLPITRTSRSIATHVRVDPPEGGLKAVCFIKCEDVRSISKQRLQSRWGRVSPQTMNTVEDHLRILMGL